MTQTRKVSVPKFHARAFVKPDTVNVESRTVDVTFSTGARVKRNSFFGIGEDFIEELEIKPSAIRLDRFKNGAPVLKDHNNSVESIIGVVERAQVKKDDFSGTIRFSERPEAEQIFRDVQSGVIRNVSIGYVVHRMKEMPEADGLKVFRAVDFEPMEVSLVAVPADSGARVRTASNEVFECELLSEGGDEMANESQTPNAPELNGRSHPEVETPKIDEAQIRKEAMELERTRCTAIRTAVVQAKLDGSVADDMINRGITADEARTEVLAKLAEKDKEQATRSENVQVGEDNTFVGMKRGIENAILHRMKPAKHKLDEQGQQFRNCRLLDMVRDLEEYRGRSTRGMSSMELATRGLHSTSDFPELLANVQNKSLRDAYEESPQTFGPFVRRVTVSDFKEISRTQLGDAPALLEKQENQEYQHGSMSEQAEKYSVKEYGRIVAVGRRVLIDDDLGSMSRLSEMFGRQAANLESDLVWAIVTSNPLMADGNALFSAAHGNLAGVGAGISISTLGDAREAMRLQTGLDGNKLNIRPSWLVVPAALETVADQFTSQITPDSSGNVNPFQGGGRSALNPVAEPRLDDNSSDAWYVFSDTGAIDIFEMAMLSGEEGPVIDSMIDFDTDGMKMKARHTVGVKAIDHRGVYKNPGV